MGRQVQGVLRNRPVAAAGDTFMFGTYLASSARLLWRIIAKYGIDPEPVFREAGLEPALLTEPRARYASEKIVKVWMRASELTADPCFGLEAADTWRPTDYHAVGYALLASSSLRKALERLVRYVRIVNDMAELELTTTERRVTITLVHPASATLLLAQQEQARWAALTAVCRSIYDGPLDPLELSLEQAAPPCQDRIAAFFRCPIRFGAFASSLAFDSVAADRPLVNANRELALANDRIAAQYLAGLRRDDVVSGVKAAVTDHLPSGTPSHEAIAKALHVSNRTLQRKLKSRETTFRETIDSVRRDLASAYIRDATLSLTEIGFLLGFSDASTFSRAFRRWTGEAPSRYRRQMT